VRRPPQPRSFQPRDEIDPHCTDDVAYWSLRFDCTVDELHDAVARVGPRAAAVATEFGVPLPAT
jgi:hypothetical protein